MLSYTKTLKNSKFCKRQAIFILRLSFSLHLTENDFTIKGKNIIRLPQVYSIFEQYYKSSVTATVRRLSLNSNSKLYNSQQSHEAHGLRTGSIIQILSREFPKRHNLLPQQQGLSCILKVRKFASNPDWMYEASWLKRNKKESNLLPALIHVTICRVTERFTGSRLWSYCILHSYLLQEHYSIFSSVLGKKKKDPRGKNKLLFFFPKSFISIQFLNPLSL